MPKVKETTEQQATANPDLQALRDQVAAANLRLTLTHLEKKIARAKLKNIDEAIDAVILKTGKVEKKGRNSYHGYDYVKAADIIEEIRKAVAEEGITIIPLGIREETRVATQGRNGDIITGIIDYKLTGPDGSFKIIPLKAQGQDSGDKAYYKLTTGAMKYLFIQVFLIPQGDDPEDDKGRKPEPDNQPNGQQQNGGQSWKDKKNKPNQDRYQPNGQQQSQKPEAPAAPAAEAPKAEKPAITKNQVKQAEELYKSGKIEEAREFVKQYTLSDNAKNHFKQLAKEYGPKEAENKPANESQGQTPGKPNAVAEAAAEATQAAAAPVMQVVPEEPEAPRRKPDLPNEISYTTFKLIDNNELEEAERVLSLYTLSDEAEETFRDRLLKAYEKREAGSQAAAEAPKADTSGPCTSSQKEELITLLRHESVPRRLKTEKLLKINTYTSNRIEEIIAEVKEGIIAFEEQKPD